ncbi:MAG: hypothetical protein HC869_05755 [Rhodospirillales bacterium]|nr:hypothetical protein [Rhodospirillales bacterium]
MGSIFGWSLGIGASVAALVVVAALKFQSPNLAYVHMAVAAVACTCIALAAVRELRKSESSELLASVGVRYLGLIWTWGALALIVTYAFVLQWREWWHFSLVFVALAGAGLFLAATLRKDAESGADDDTMLKLARIWIRVHLGAAIITVVGLIVDGKMVRFLVPRHQDWAAQNIFFFGAIALGIISWHALRAMRAVQPAKS